MLSQGECNEAAIAVNYQGFETSTEEEYNWQSYPAGCYLLAYGANPYDWQTTDLWFNPDFNSTVLCSVEEQCICRRDDQDPYMGCEQYGCPSGMQSLDTAAAAQSDYPMQMDADRFLLRTNGFPMNPCRDAECCLLAHNWVYQHYSQNATHYSDFEPTYTTTVVNTDTRVEGAYIFFGNDEINGWCNVYDGSVQAGGPTGIPCSNIRRCVDRVDSSVLAVASSMKRQAVMNSVMNRLGVFRIAETGALEEPEDITEDKDDSSDQEQYEMVEIWAPNSFRSAPRLTGGFAVFLAILAFLNRMSRS